MKISGLLLASDGVDQHTIIDTIDAPFYGGKKFLVREKILEPSLSLVSGEPLVAASMRALFEACSISDVVVVGNRDQVEQLEKLASQYAQGKPYRVVEAVGHIGEIIASGAERIHVPGYFFILQADLPYVSGSSIDLAVLEVLDLQDSTKVYFPAVSRGFFARWGSSWRRSFLTLSVNGKPRRLKMLDFVIADSKYINPEFVRKFYNIRTFTRSLKGKFNFAREFSSFIPVALMSYLGRGISISDLENIVSNLNGSQIRIVEVSNPAYAVFMKDIDTRGDYQVYRRSEI